MKVFILTSSRFGTAAHHLPLLIQSKACEISMVILNEGVIFNKYQFYKRKILKVFKVGLLGALNGIRMRKWYDVDLNKFIKINELESICKKNNIPFHVTQNINNQTTINLIKNTTVDLGISLGNGYIQPKIFNIPKYGMINIHHEILPDYQNAQSVIWQIYNMSHITGYTIHKIDRHIDTGEIIYQQNIPIIFQNTLRYTVAKTSSLLLQSSIDGLLKVINDFDHFFSNARVQMHGTSYTTPTIWQYVRMEINFRKLKNTYPNESKTK